MRIQSPLSNLSSVLLQAKYSANQYERILRTNEAATRAVLIDPILRALGWDTANIYMVVVEKSYAQTRLDYALQDSNSDVKVIVEAKSLGADLNQPGTIMTLVQYAFTYGLQDIFLTDGLRWHHYTNFQPGNLTPSKILSLTNDSPVECAAYLVQRLDAAKFWPDTQTLDAVSQQVSQLEDALSTLQQEIASISKLVAHTDEGAETAFAEVERERRQNLSYTDLTAIGNATGTRPLSLRLPDNTYLQVSKWKDVLRECCKFALAKNLAIAIPFPDKAGRNVSLLSEHRPPPSISNVELQYNGQTIYLYATYDANNCIANSLHVLRQIPEGEQRVNAAVSYTQRE